MRTILMLQTDALKIALLNGQPSLLDGLYRRWSFLRAILNEDGIGSLGLSLESSTPAVGSLGLSLE
jgi:hypothetical protein